MKYFTGVGSRETPPDILDLMKDIAIYLSFNNWVLRSGGAPGADTAFEEGVDCIQGPKQIFLPWKGFNGNKSPFYNIPSEAFDISREAYGERLDYMKRPIKLLMARNVLQVLGHTLDEPSGLVVCWTPDGIFDGSKRSRKTGGTGQAISIATRYNVPVFNLAHHCFDDIDEFINNYDSETPAHNNT